MDKQYKLLADFEALVGLKPAQACQLLGIAYSTYAAYRNCGRPLQPYHHNHIADISLIAKLSSRALKKLIDERINGQTN
jgi:hypothetical protein